MCNILYEIYVGMVKYFMSIPIIKSNTTFIELQNTVLKCCSHGDWLLLSFILDNIPVVLRPAFLDMLDGKLAEQRNK